MPTATVTARSVLADLERMGTAQNIKVYARHGVGPAMFGVSYANLGKLQKAIKQDQEIAVALWDSGNHDARVLATMVADPSAMTLGQLNTWARELDNYALTDAFASLVARTPHRRKKAEQWMKSAGEWTGRTGWLVATSMARDDDLPNDYFIDLLGTVEAEIHNRKNRVRDAMNYALIAIGMRNAVLEKRAIAAARRIGPVQVDHGETGCKTPEAVAYIRKAAARKR